MTASAYDQFLANKMRIVRPSGIDDPPAINGKLFDFQRDITRWALRIGKAAVWADCGLGKSWIAIEWARIVAHHTAAPVLILTPVAVAQQFEAEGRKLGVDVTHVRDGSECSTHPIVVTNYERLHRFDAAHFGGVVLDESSVLKDHTSKTRSQLIDSFSNTRYRLCCTATPAPNDFVELGNHAEFLGAMSRTEMLSTYFCHDGGSTQDWRLKGHAESDFWRWISSWAVNLKHPSDLGYSSEGYDLPALDITHHRVESAACFGSSDQASLFPDHARTLSEQRAARRSSLSARVDVAAELVNGSDVPWIVWCDLNAESEALRDAIGDAVEVRGSDSVTVKEDRIYGFATGAHRVLVTKPSIAGHGMNWQHCARVAFVGVSHSFEQWYQAIRRCWRFGQRKPVSCHIITSEQEGAVVESLERKQRDADRLTRGMVAHMADLTREQLGQTARSMLSYAPAANMRRPTWLTTRQQ
jgi:hypothetical protein